MPSNSFPGLTRVKGQKRIYTAAFDESSSPSPSTSPPPILRPQPPPSKPNSSKGAQEKDKKDKKKKEKRAKAKHLLEKSSSSPEPSKDAHIPAMPKHNQYVICTYKALDPRAKLITHLGASYEHLYQAAWMLPRYVGAFIDYDTVLTKGLPRDGTYRHDDPECTHLIYNECWEVRCCFSLIKLHFPGIQDHVHYLREDTDLVAQLAKFITESARKTRSDDAGHIREHIFEIAGWKDNLLKTKTERGFKHVVTGCLLCPIDQLAEFDRDPLIFCRGLQDRHDDCAWVTADDWPMFLYDMSEYNPNDVRAGLFKSQLMLKCYKLIFTGPASVPIIGKAAGGKLKGKPPVIKNMEDAAESINVHTITYIACLVRHALNAQAEWAVEDLDFNSGDFVRSILTLALRNINWQEDISEWYRHRVLYKSCKREQPTNWKTMYSKMLDQTSGDREYTHEPAEGVSKAEDEQGANEELEYNHLMKKTKMLRGRRTWNNR
ncbi:hypothetical protein BN946_scf184936.g29 [Trametes cinnabarina]|uniref:Uncharacterized protein n=1 Tax=Pycnoporus cinnabarinus TaxID=5643 RepID=A0A060SZA5_PYCCI|nr:hypothetical protein BN946_scf184936.g29 [Trametes cinnabarina]